MGRVVMMSFPIEVLEPALRMEDYPGIGRGVGEREGFRRGR